MMNRVCEEFEVTAAQAQNDIREFLDSLLEGKQFSSLPKAARAFRQGLSAMPNAQSVLALIEKVDTCYRQPLTESFPP